MYKLASDRGVGAVLSQLDDQGRDRPVAYYSRKLLPREKKYSTIEKECLAIKLSIRVTPISWDEHLPYKLITILWNG